MSVEELQKRIEELEQELAPLRTFKDCCVVQYYGKEHFEGELETLDIDRELTDEDFISISNYIKNDETMYNVIGERLTELIAEWCEENPQKEEEEEMENKVYQVRRYIEIIFDENYNDEGDCELIEKKDFETREDAKKYYDTLNNIGKNLSYYNKIEGDDDYAVIEEIFENTLLSFNKISVIDLKCLCKLHEIKGYSKLKKQELLNILKTHSYFQGRFEEIVEEEEEKRLCQCCEESLNINETNYVMILGYGWDNICKKCIKKHHEKCECGNIRRKEEKIDYDDFCDHCKHWGDDPEECVGCGIILGEDYCPCGNCYCSNKTCDNCYEKLRNKCGDNLQEEIEEIRKNYNELPEEEKTEEKLQELCDEIPIVDEDDVHILDESYTTPCFDPLCEDCGEGKYYFS